MNIEYINRTLDAIGAVYDIQKREDVDEATLNTIIEMVLTTSRFPLTSEEKDRIREKAKYDLLSKQDDGIMLTDDYAHYDWYNDRINEDGQDTFFWDRYREYLKNHSQLSIPAINKLDFNTLRDLMNHLGDPKSKSPFLRRGLILGDVQSGKTATYIGYICKAADAGYKVIILLTGITENLRSQTQRRVEEGFVGFDITESNPTRVGVGLDGKPLMVTALTSREDDFVGNKDKIMTSLENSKVVLCIVKKNARVLDKLYKWLKTLNVDETIGKINYPMLMIDDEADNASVNTNKPEESPTVVNQSIRNLLNLFVQRSYVGFTATPFANIFIDPEAPDELFPENFMYALPTPEQYVGANKIFYPEGEYNKSLCYVNDAGMREDDGFSFYAKHKKEWKGALPQSLTQSLYVYLLANTIRDLRGDETQPRGMMINISRFTKVHKYVKSKVEKEFQRIYRKIKFDLIPDMEQIEKIPELKMLYELWKKHYSDLEFSWNDICAQILKSCENIQIMVVNSSKDADKLDYEKNPSLRVIAIGGLSLSRGITIEGLMVSYFFRNTATYDVLLQMGRWFGYRFGYDDIFRIWSGRKSVEWYAEIAESVDILRKDLIKMRDLKKTPRDFGFRVRNDSNELKITAPNKMRTATSEEEFITFYGEYSETHYIESDYAKNQDNWNAIKNLIELEDEHGNKIKKCDSYGIVKDIHKEQIISLLPKLNIHPSNTKLDMHSMKKFLEDTGNIKLNRWDLIIVNGEKTNEMIPNINLDIPMVSRKGLVDESDSSRISVGRRGKLTTPRDGLFGYDVEENRKTIDKAKELYRQEYLERKKSTCEYVDDKEFPATTWFKYVENRKPTIFVYYMNMTTYDAKEIGEKRAQYFDNRAQGWIGLAIGIPSCGEIGEKHKYKVNRIYVALEDLEESFEE